MDETPLYLSDQGCITVYFKSVFIQFKWLVIRSSAFSESYTDIFSSHSYTIRWKVRETFMSRGRVCISPVGQRNRETNGALSLCFHHTYNASPSTLNTKQPSSAASRLKRSLSVVDLKQSWQDQCQSYVPCLLKVRRSWDTSCLTSQSVTTVR